MISLIAICGADGAGKSTLSELLCQKRQYIPVPFANPIKSMIRDLIMRQGVDSGTARRMIYGDLKDKPSPQLGGRTPREFMQALGTDLPRLMDLHETLWTGVWRRTVEYLAGTDTNRIVVDDLRFYHEETTINVMDWRSKIIIRIEREGHEPGPHPSSNSYLKLNPDLTITNDGASIDMLHELEYWAARNNIEL